MTENPSAPDPMSTPEGVPTQASAWRNGLTAVTALLAAALIVRGPGDLADLHVAVQVLVAALLVAGFALLVRAILVAAAAATAGSVAGEVAGARRFAVAGVALVGFAVLGDGWPPPRPPPPSSSSSPTTTGSSAVWSRWNPTVMSPCCPTRVSRRTGSPRRPARWCRSPLSTA
ncbi:hypothetical protein ACFQZ4_47625 [Catellatospora coxensis]